MSAKAGKQGIKRAVRVAKDRSKMRRLTAERQPTTINYAKKSRRRTSREVTMLRNSNRWGHPAVASKGIPAWKGSPRDI